VPSIETKEYVLGIDLGSNSLGWAMIGLIDGEPAQLIRAGVRIFDAGMDGDLESGQEESRNKARRDARLHRRQLWRRARRINKVAHLLQRFGFLPVGNLHSPDARQDYFNRLDAEILASPWFSAKEQSGAFPEPHQTLPYILRACALNEPLEPYFLGRAFYHLAQRRGFQSNRLRPARKDEDLGVVKQGIRDLRTQMQAAGARTLGEYFARMSPAERPFEEHIRGADRWTARDMYKEEFEKIWEVQASHHPNLLTAEHKKALYDAIFYQRPLWFDENTIGGCELEPGCRRAPAYLLVSQRFRLLQTVNNFKVIPPGETERPLTPEDRQKLIDELELKGDLTYAKIRKLLGLSKDYAFNLERAKNESIKGNRTNADFYAVFGERWLKMTPEERDQTVEYVHAFQKPDKLRRAAQKRWGLSDEAAEKLSEITLEADYMNLSRRAMEKLMPLLEQGMAYGEARRLVYPEKFSAIQPAAFLPMVKAALPEVRNPAVLRSLTELRKVVNAVIHYYGKPQEIRIELARELRKSKKQRETLTRKNRENEAARKQAAKRIDEITGDKNPSRDDIRRVLLLDECGCHCVYCGEPISGSNFLGKESQIDIDHVIPFSRSLDDSFTNLVLCHSHCNRLKGDRTPYEAFAGEPERYERILDRVRKFSGDSRTRAEKLRRFKLNHEELTKFLEDFRNRQLNDTAYAARLAAQYLSLLYGGVADAEGRRRVYATSGQATSYLRSLWKLNSILGDGTTSNGGRISKERTDHRHHAVDAVVIGLTDAGMMKRLSDAARRAPLEGRRRFAGLEAPWVNFVDTVRQQIDQIVVSHRVSKKVSGALHEETIYSPPFPDKKVRVRKPLNALTRSEVEDITDPVVKKLVLEKLGDDDPKKVFAHEANLPCLETRDGRRIPIRRVRIAKATPVFPLGEGRTVRHVTSESNHHVEIYAALDERGNETRWDGEVVSLYEAYQRKKAGQPIVQRDHGPLVKFKFSLAPGEAIECDGEQGQRRLLVVRSFTQLSAGQIVIGLAPVNDARKKSDMQKSRDWVWKVPNTLRECHARKVSVSPIGEVCKAND
jgi:CRISPR-associated endonuclease Csn1